MGKFLELSHSDISQLLKNLLVRRLPKSALLFNVAHLYLNTKMTDVVSTKFYAYNGNIDGEDAFLLAKQDKKKYYNSVTWTLCGPEAKYVTTDMFKAFDVHVDWTIRNSMTAVHVDIKDGIADLCRKHGVLQEWGPNSVYWHRGYAECSSPELAKNVTVVELDAAGVRKLVEHWDYGSESTYNEVLETCGYVPSAGVKVDNELVSWAYTSTDGAIHALFTLESHRRKGYSQILLRSLSEMLAKKGMHAITEVENHNLPSAKLMLSVGYQFSYSQHWIEYTPNSCEPRWSKS